MVYEIISASFLGFMQLFRDVSDTELGLSFIGDVQMVISQRGDASASGSAGQEAQLHQVRLVNILQGDRLFADGSGQGLQAHRAARVVLDVEEQ